MLWYPPHMGHFRELAHALQWGEQLDLSGGYTSAKYFNNFLDLPCVLVKDLREKRSIKQNITENHQNHKMISFFNFVILQKLNSYILRIDEFKIIDLIHRKPEASW